MEKEERMKVSFTRWGKRLKKEAQKKGDSFVPLPEYPRPSLVREGYWENLNGTWEMAVEKDPGWGEEKCPATFSGKILVPFSPEAPLSGADHQLLPGEVLYYRRRLSLHVKKEGRYLLHFGAVDQSCRVYVNDSFAGEHVGGYLPFTLDITELLKPHGNILWLAVWDESDTGTHARGKQKLKNGGMWYTAQSGIWQTVWIEWVPELYIKSVLCTPASDLKGVRFTVEAAGKRQGPGEKEKKEEGRAGEKEGKEEREEKKGIKEEETLWITATISLQKEVVGEVSFPLGEEGFFPMEDPRLWSPEDPALYDVSFSLGKDQVRSYFGMRRITRERDVSGIWRTYLNGKPLFLTGLLDQGYYPDGLYTAPSQEALESDIRQMKALGFNFLRKHIKIEPERFYYACDKLGMMLWQDMVNGGSSYNDTFVTTLPNVFPILGRIVKDSHYGWFSRVEEESREEYARELEETVRLLANHPSLVAWVPFNEGWGQFDARQASRRVFALDPTRLVDEASGWFDQGGGDFYSIHNYFRRLRVRPRKNRVVALTECGGYSLLIEGHSMADKVYGYRKYARKEELERGLTRLWERELLPAISHGLCVSIYTQVSDIEEEVNGLLTYDREICKVDASLMRELNERLQKAYEEAVSRKPARRRK